jgi:hypothetical protein
MKLKLRALLSAQSELANTLELQMVELSTEQASSPPLEIITKDIICHIGKGPIFRPAEAHRKKKPQKPSSKKTVSTKRKGMTKEEEAEAQKKAEKDKIRRMPNDDPRKDRWKVKMRDPDDMENLPGPGLVQYPDGSQVLLHEWLGDARTDLIVS